MLLFIVNRYVESVLNINSVKLQLVILDSIQCGKMLKPDNLTSPIKSCRMYG
jgi:hypothetical protein